MTPGETGVLVLAVILGVWVITSLVRNRKMTRTKSRKGQSSQVGPKRSSAPPSVNAGGGSSTVPAEPLRRVSVLDVLAIATIAAVIVLALMLFIRNPNFVMPYLYAERKIITLIVLAVLVLLVLAAAGIVTGQSSSETDIPSKEAEPVPPPTPPVAPRPEPPPDIPPVAPFTPQQLSQDDLQVVTQHLTALFDSSLKERRLADSTGASLLMEQVAALENNLADLSRRLGAVERANVDRTSKKDPEVQQLAVALAEMQKDVSEFRAVSVAWLEPADVHHVIFRKPFTDVSPETVESLRRKWQLVTRSQQYRSRLVAWATSAELSLVSRHFHDLLSLGLTTFAPAFGGQREKHWRGLERSSHAQFLGVAAFIDRIASLATSATTDPAAGLRGLRQEEEQYGWSCVPLPYGDVTGEISEHQAEDFIRVSAEKLLENLIVPAVRLYQELFEAPRHEGLAGGAPSELDYELGTFERADLTRGSVRSAIERGAKVLGFEYVSIPLYTAFLGEFHRWLSPELCEDVTWTAWFGEERDMQGRRVVRLPHPAFRDVVTGAVLNRGAAAIVGVSGHA
jgi:hypothetical protein